MLAWKKRAVQLALGVAIFGSAGAIVQVRFWEGIVLVAAGAAYAVVIEAIG